MRRCVAMVLLGCGVGCRPVAVEPTPAPAEPPVAPAREVVPQVSSAVPAPAPAPEPEPVPLVKPWVPRDESRILAVQPYVAEAAAEHGVDPYLINGLIWVESEFRTKAKNKSGARGLMQLMPTTAKALGRALHRPAQVYDAEFNVHAGTFYLSRQLARFEGDEALALAAYARGPGKVRAWVEAGEPLPGSLEGFVTKVQRTRDVFAALGWPEPVVAAGNAADDEATEHAAPAERPPGDANAANQANQ
jgi:soluble lytic murein transglycosylase-like protein